MVAPTLSATNTVSAPIAGGGPVAASQMLRLRRFGEAASDLEIDLSGPSPPEVVTEILAACTTDQFGQPVERRRLWEMSVGARIASLLVLADREDAGTFAIALRCPAAGCGESIEVSLTLDEILGVASEDGADPFPVKADGRTFHLRRPTGADQLAWLRRDDLDGADVAPAILHSLIVAGPVAELTAAGRAALEEALDTHDPLIRFTLTAVCPYCQAAHEHETPLTAYALRTLRQVQSRLIEEVHALAVAYGWPESEVLAIPSWRRARYLSLVERERGHR